MPRATINRDEEHRFELKTCPPDGYVLLRKLSFHEMTQRQDIAGKMIYEQRDQLNRQQRRRQGQRGPGAGVSEDPVVRSMLEMANVAVMEFEFRNCILGHNLEDENGTLLDFTNPIALKNLNPSIGKEISDLIDDLNYVDDEAATSPLESAPISSLPDGENEHEITTA